MTGAPAPACAGLLICDLDGTLIDNHAVMIEAFTTAYRKVVGRTDPPIDALCALLGRDLSEILRILGLPEGMRAIFIEESYRLLPSIRLFPGIADLLKNLHDSGWSLAIATGKDGDRARKILKSLDVLDRFTVVFGGDEVARCKPEREVIDRIRAACSGSVEQVWMIGDAQADIECAANAGIPSILATWSGRAWTPTAGATCLIAASPHHIPAILERQR